MHEHRQEHRHRVFFVSCFVYYTQVEASQRAHHLLSQICHVLYRRVVDSFLYHSPNAVINHLMSLLFGGHMSAAMNLEFLTKNQLHYLTYTMS